VAEADGELLTPAEAAGRLARIRGQMAEALRRSGRGPGDAALLAVSKTFPPQAVSAFLAAGQKDFGESYIQEAKDKIPLVPPEANWHFIGHLQSNKAKYAAPLFSVLHALDSISLAAELDRRLAAAGRTMRVYLQVNVSGEDVKSGMEPGELEGFIEALAKYPALIPEGLMTMPPYDPDPEVSRPHFAALRELRDKKCPHLKGLSMGMSGDFAVALEEGATIVRVGTSLFGQRL
jgi:pyridoxal phosphate enzyme (YggS family)